MRGTTWRLWLGAELRGDGVRFRVWAPRARLVAVEIYPPAGPAVYPLERSAGGLHAGLVPGLRAGDLYKFKLDDGNSYPDPCSRFQPQGVHGPSAVVDPESFDWGDGDWQGVGPEGLVIYECHVGAYTPEGTFDGLREQLGELKRLGVNAIQIMPVAEFPGRWNWGYDGVDLYAPSHVYGGPEGLKRLVDAAHELGLGIILDVVYNHLGPAGNYLRAYSPYYFTSAYETPWGEALNYDGEGSRETREYVIQNACYWLNEYHLDGLRLDATHAICDASPVHILRELADRARASLPPGRRVMLLAEDGRNDVRFLHTPLEGGYGMDMVYADDFHHEVRVLLTGEREGYYADYEGSPERIARAIAEGFIYQGQPSLYSGAPRGTKVTDEAAWRFLFALQNHDQVGNRALGERLNQVIDLGRYAAATALLLLAPETPSLFMGQEFAASTPFLYFTDHEPELGGLVTAGRRREFARFSAFSDPERRKRIPDPQAEETFRRSVLDLGERQNHGGTYRMHRDLVALRRLDPVFRRQDRRKLRVGTLRRGVIALHRWHESEHRLVLVNFGGTQTVDLDADALTQALPPEARYVLWRSADPDYGTSPTRLPREEKMEGPFRLPAACAIVLGHRGTSGK
ncbi:MAG: malto-oligosyltrehalose trehalohydrolase [Chloroflexota bacterium]